METLPLLATRIRGVTTTMTHHSSRYVRAPAWTLRTALAVGGRRLRHAVLDEAMGAELSARYGIEPERMVVVDNAGLMPLPPAATDSADRRGVVHLSNLSAAKGLAAVLEVADRTGIEIRLVGAPSKDAISLLADAGNRRVPFIAVGPRHGEAKMQELNAARCMLFPSSYQHEAQPLVLYEAVAAGCVPIVWRNGWIGEQLGRLGLDAYVFPIGDVAGVAEAVRQICEMDGRTFSELSDGVRSAFEEQHACSRQQFRALID